MRATFAFKGGGKRRKPVAHHAVRELTQNTNRAGKARQREKERKQMSKTESNFEAVSAERKREIARQMGLSLQQFHAGNFSIIQDKDDPQSHDKIKEVVNLLFRAANSDQKNQQPKFPL